MNNDIKINKTQRHGTSQQEYDTRWDAIFGRDLLPEPTEQFRVNNAGKTERLFEGQWELDLSAKND